MQTKRDVVDPGGDLKRAGGGGGPPRGAERGRQLIRYFGRVQRAGRNHGDKNNMYLAEMRSNSLFLWVFTPSHLPTT